MAGQIQRTRGKAAYVRAAHAAVLPRNITCIVTAANSAGSVPATTNPTAAVAAA